MGRDKSAHTLRIEMYFERETGIVKRYARGAGYTNNSDTSQITTKKENNEDNDDDNLNDHVERNDFNVRKRPLPDAEIEQLSIVARTTYTIKNEAGISPTMSTNRRTVARKANFSYCFTQFNDIPVSIMKKLQLTLVQVPKYFDSALSVEASILPIEHAPILDAASDGGNIVIPRAKSYKTPYDKTLDDFFSLISINNSSTVIEYHY